jgi:hypothetical protein
MRLDPTIMYGLRTRQRAILGTPWHIKAQDVEDIAQKEAAAAIEKRIRMMPKLTNFLLALKEDVWYGKSAAQVLYHWTKVDGRWGISPKGHIPVHGDKLVTFYNGATGIRVGPLYKGKTTVTDYNIVHVLEPDERESFVIGSFEPEDADYIQPWFSGAVMGFGLRGRLYWWWSLKNQALKYQEDYLQWFSQGLTIYQYDAQNPAAKDEVVTRLKEHQGKPFLLYPRFHDGGPGYDPVIRIQADSSSASFLQSLMEYYDRVIVQMILGQTLTTGTAPTGMGSGVAAAHESTAAQVLKYDCEVTADYLTSDLVRVLYEYTYPGMPVGSWQYSLDQVDVAERLQAVQVFTGLGGQVDEESLREDLGLAELRPGKATLGAQPKEGA